MSNVRVRFAPSPTGDLHVGNARTALFNWLFARQNEGIFVLRIEDTDRLRTKKVFEQNLLDELRWLGIDWDEGPEKNGPYGPYHQSERLDIYKSYLEELIASGKVYPCYCSEEELERQRQAALAKSQMPRYRGTCRSLTAQERERLEAEGRRPTYRFEVTGDALAFTDMIRGAMKFDSRSIGDFIIVRSNGLPAYNFAVVIDDHLMKITHVIRGEDHLSNTAVQLLLYRALGFTPPHFAHHSLILGKDRTKLSKRHGAVSVREFRQQGFLPEVLLNYLALLGNSFGEGREVCDLSEIIKMFALDKTGRGGAIFDEHKLRWLNGIYLKKYARERLLDAAMPFIKEAGYANSHNAFNPEKLLSIIDAVHDNISTLGEIRDYLLLFDDNKYELPPEMVALLREPEFIGVLKSFREALISQTSTEDETFQKAIKQVQLATGKKGKALYLPIRYALTGSSSGLELDKIIAILGKQSLIERLNRALAIVEVL